MLVYFKLAFYAVTYLSFLHRYIIVYCIDLSLLEMAHKQSHFDFWQVMPIVLVC